MLTLPAPVTVAPRRAAGRARVLFGLTLMVAGLILPATRVSAHAIVIGTDPPDGTVVEVAPGSVVVTFTESVTLATEGNTVLNDEARDVAVEAEAVGDKVRLSLPPELAQGTYVITWHVISVDSHPVTGSSIFHVGAPSTAAAIPADEPAPRALEGTRAVATGLLYGATLVAIGAGWFGRRWRGEAAPRVDRLVTRCGLAGLGLLVVVAALRVVEISGRWSGATEVDVIADTLSGPIGSFVALLAVGLAAQVVAPRWGGRLRLPLWSAGAVAVLAGAASEGHTRSASPFWLVLVGDAVHVGAAAIWFGGVAALVAVRTAAPAPERRVWAADVSGHAVVAVAVVAAGGLAMAVAIASDASTFTSTRWGRTVLIKAALVLILVGIGWYNRYRVVPHLGDDGPAGVGAMSRLRSTLRLELALFAAVLVATGVAVGSSPVTAVGGPAVTPVDEPLPGWYTESVALSSGQGWAHFDLEPVALGSNDLYVVIADDDGRPLELLWEPTVWLAERDQGVEPIDVQVTQVEDGWYHAVIQVPFPGRWEITVDARTGTFDSGQAVVTVDIG